MIRYISFNFEMITKVILLFSLGMMFKICLCVNLKPSPILKETCLIVAENTYSSVKNIPNENKCPGFICWESQLTLVNKAKISRMYNKYRQTVMKSQKLRSMLKMNWHWSLEEEVIRLSSTCPGEILFPRKYARNVEGLDFNLMCEYNGATTYLKTATQEEFLNQFDTFLNNNSMHDFDDYQRFRRSSALYFGCALTITQNNDSKAYFLCAYCSKEQSLSATFNYCRRYALEMKSQQFPFLCAAKHIDFYACEPINPCPGLPPKTWHGNNFSTIKQIYAMNAENDNIWLIVNETKCQIESNSKKVTNNLTLYKDPSANSWFFDFAPIPAYRRFYAGEVLKLLNNSFPNLTNEYDFIKTHIRRSRSVPTQDPNAANVINYQVYHPNCCIYLFILYSLLFIVVGVMTYVTYNHYKKKSTIL